MRSSASRRWLAVALGLTVSLGAGAPLFAQDDAAPPAWVQTLQMPEGWEAADWQAFTADWDTLADHLNANKLWASDFDQNHYSAVIDRAWVFLQDEQILSQGDWPTVNLLVARFAQTQKRFEDDRGDRLRVLFEARLAQEQQAAADSYQELQTLVRALKRLGAPQWQDQVGAVTAQWAANGDLSQIKAGQRMKMLDQLRVPVADLDQVSARFTGLINIAEAGTYTFSRFAAAPSDGDWLRVAIGGSVVLDTSLNNQWEPTVAGAVELAAGRQPITVEFSRDAYQPNVRNGVELMLMWAASPAGGGEAAVVPVPSSVFQTDGGEPGLTGVYYGNPFFEGEPVLTEVVPALQYDRGGFCHRYPEAVAALRATVLDPANAAGWGSSLRKDGTPDWRVSWALRGLSIEDRRTLLSLLLAEHPALLSKMDMGYFTVMLAMAAPIPGDTALDLVRVWSEGRPLFRTRVAAAEYSNPKTYYRVNDEHLKYGWLLRGLAERRWVLVEQLRDSCLTEADGTCDLEVLKLLLLCYEFSPEHSQAELAQFIVQRIEAIDVQQAGAGDKQAAWYVAAAVCEEAGRNAQHPTLLRGYSSLELALASAESVDVRFWVLNEMISRLISAGEDVIALSILDSVEQQYPPAGVIQGVLDDEGQPVTYAAQFQEWRAQAPVHAQLADADRDGQIREEDLARLRGEIVDLEQAEASLLALESDPRRGDAARASLARVREDLAAARNRLEAMENEGG